MNDSKVLFEKDGKTAVITLNRPHRRNALDDESKQLLAAAIRTAREDASIASVVLTGAGGHFCSGADLGGDGKEGEMPFLVRDALLGAHRWHAELMDLEKPVISAIDGFAVGAGLSLALAADFIIASDRARLVSNFPRIGFAPDLGLMYILPRLVGLVRAKEIVFSARDVLADEALSIGLVQAVAPAERLRQTAIDYARRFDDAPTHVLGMAKGIMNRAFETDRHAMTQLETAVQGICAASSYNAEAVRRFFAKEPPMYAGVERLF
ncbi:enoyl-CoA hydratase/isomerase family protein [Paraburkholderia sp. Tr-20389]|uniref:enoyl-CoA hydratase/isomerase family protein n=1 Tax=Paraburkholderia sp. Tr-20389 TaxID=2703903 RepID=UPI00197DBB97|nr:enoyl-CoA hydratase/isomerase family protein [Paraburkholderia sp. Tr-20389]MBN3755626.1 enoyl-CoA hydratase/isomerase family protein [Paraburkholderia sp. Tr-20389]